MQRGAVIYLLTSVAMKNPRGRNPTGSNWLWDFWATVVSILKTWCDWGPHHAHCESRGPQGLKRSEIQFGILWRFRRTWARVKFILPMKPFKEKAYKMRIFWSFQHLQKKMSVNPLYSSLHYQFSNAIPKWKSAHGKNSNVTFMFDRICDSLEAIISKLTCWNFLIDCSYVSKRFYNYQLNKLN